MLECSPAKKIAYNKSQMKTLIKNSETYTVTCKDYSYITVGGKYDTRWCIWITKDSLLVATI